MTSDHSTRSTFRTLGSILGCMLLLMSCRNEISEIKALTDPQNLPIQTNYEAEYHYTVRGELRNRLKAGQIDQYGGEKPYVLASKGIELFIYDSIDSETAHLTAQNGKYIESENLIIAWGKVVMTNKQGNKLETEEITFLQDSSFIFTDKYVTITTASGVIHGKGLESNDSFTKYKIIQPTGDLYMKDEPQQP
jgi:LPS export ABC transporter protein LptC